jgi:hypothetical protein
MTSEGAMDSDVGDTVADVLRAAYYYSLVDGHRAVQPAMVLVAAARNDDVVARPVLGAPVAEARSRLRPQNATEQAAGWDSMPQACRYAPALREAGWWVYRGADDDNRAQAEQRGGAPSWTATLCAALDRAGREADNAGARRLGITHLLLGILDADEPSTRSLAAALGLDFTALVKQLRTTEPETSPRPFTPLVDLIAPFGAIEEKAPWPVRWIPRMVARLTARDRRWRGPVIPGLEAEILRQAVRSGHREVQTSAVLLAVMSLDDQLKTAGRRLRDPYIAHNNAGQVLRSAGVDPDRVRAVAEGLTEEGGHLPDAESAKRFWGTGKPGDPSWGRAAARVADRAASIAEQREHRDVGTSHLLAAMLDQADSSAVRLLLEAGVDLEDLHLRANESLVDV